MKKIILIATVLFSATATYAQGEVGNIYVKPQVGMTIANMTKSEGSYKVGLVGGVEFEAPVASKMSVSFGAVYSMQGCKGSNETAAEFELDDVSIRLGYINVPILFNVYLAKGFSVKAGVQPGILVNSSMHGSLGNASASQSLKDYMNTFDLSIPVGLSYEYKNVVVDGRYNIGMLKTVKEAAEGSKNSVFQITLGYKFNLAKK